MTRERHRHAHLRNVCASAFTLPFPRQTRNLRHQMRVDLDFIERPPRAQARRVDDPFGQIDSMV